MDDVVFEKIRKESISLEKYGICSLAWEKENAKRLISLIINDNVGILGGDVYKVGIQKLEPLYDNWFCETKECETKEEYFYRSKIESLHYIENYQVFPEETILFSITFTEKVI